MELFDNHKKLYRAAGGLFLLLTIWVAVLPAYKNQADNAPLPDAQPLSEAAQAGKLVFIANGCVACHTQQVRNIESDKVWGKRPSVSGDYADNHRIDAWRNTATLMGTERTGPDLTNIGARQPSEDWHLSHLYNPRIVVKESIMPAYTWLFKVKPQAGKGDVVVKVPKEFIDGDTGVVVATKDALNLVAYLQALKQADLPRDARIPLFLYQRKEAAATGAAGGAGAADGVALYAANCQACHQPNGEGLQGSFPALKGSKVVLNTDPEQMVAIIMNGYTGRQSDGFGPMPGVGTNNELKPEEITAIMNHEKSSWGNDGKPVTVEEITKLIDKVKGGPPVNTPPGAGAAVTAAAPAPDSGKTTAVTANAKK